MAYMSTTPTPTVNIETLDFVDVSVRTRGDFMAPNNLRSFLDSQLGQAQSNLLNEQIRAQGVVPNETTIRRALFAEQASQTMGYRQPDILANNAPNPEGKMTEAQLIMNYGPGGQRPGIMVDPSPVSKPGFGLA